MLYFDDNAISRLSDIGDLKEKLREAFAASPAVHSRSHFDLPGDTGDVLLLMPSWHRENALGVKLLTVSPQRRAEGHPTINGLYVLFDRDSGVATAIFEAAALTAFRTAGVCALAASLLAPATARTMLMLGTGALAAPLIQAHASVRHLDRVLIWGRDAEKAHRVAHALPPHSPRTEVVRDVKDHLAEADIICSATHSGEALVLGSLVHPGSYVSLVGSFAPNMREGDDALFQRARVVVDTHHALEESGDLIGPLQSGVLKKPVMDLHDLVASHARLIDQADRDIHLFKTVGTGLADLVAATLLMSRYRDHSSSVAKILPVQIG